MNGVGLLSTGSPKEDSRSTSRDCWRDRLAALRWRDWAMAKGSCRFLSLVSIEPALTVVFDGFNASAANGLCTLEEPVTVSYWSPQKQQKQENKKITSKCLKRRLQHNTRRHGESTQRAMQCLLEHTFVSSSAEISKSANPALDRIGNSITCSHGTIFCLRPL